MHASSHSCSYSTFLKKEKNVKINESRDAYTRDLSSSVTRGHTYPHVYKKMLKLKMSFTLTDI